MSSTRQLGLRKWMDFWFLPRDPHSLSTVRVGAGLVAILHFVALLMEGQDWLGPMGWLDVDSSRYLIGDDVDGTGSRYRWSLLYRYPECVNWVVGLGIFASAAAVAGIGSRIAPLTVWFCLCTFHHRAPLVTLVYEPLLVATMAYLTIDTGRTAWTLRPGFTSGKERVSVNIAVQLLFCHLLIWIAFSLSSMLANPVWWNGEAG
jgi:hypothetical protein